MSVFGKYCPLVIVSISQKINVNVSLNAFCISSVSLLVNYITFVS